VHPSGFFTSPTAHFKRTGDKASFASSLNQYVSRVIIYRHKFMNIDPHKLSYMYFRILDKYMNTSTTKCVKKLIKNYISGSIGR
jgi:hypothetical protein